MELRDVEYFAAVAEHGNVRRAAEALDLSPPALSKSLRRLESVMQAKVVLRTPKGVDLTPAGTALLAQVGRIRLTLNDITREVTDISHGRVGRLRVAASPAVGVDLPTAYVALSKEAPDLTIQIMTTDNDVSLPMLLKGELDLVFNYLDYAPFVPHDSLVMEHLYDEIIVVCASADHRLARRRRVALADLAGERWAVSNVHLLNVTRLQKAFHDSGLPPPRVAIEARSVQLRLQAIAASNLLGYIPRRILRGAGRGCGVKELPVKELLWRRSVGVIHRAGGYISPAAKRFINVLKAMATEISREKT
jgi:DNA-binding transcriptional LysR family regulator